MIRLSAAAAWLARWTESHIIPLALTGLAIAAYIATGASAMTRWLGGAAIAVWFLFQAIDADEAFDVPHDDNDDEDYYL